VIIFAVLTVAATGMGFSRSVAFFRWCLQASSTMHARAVYSLLHAPMTFFIANPTGRILNRFSKDQNIVDELMPITLFDFIQSALFVLAAVVLVCVSLPELLALLAPLVYGFYVARRRFLASSREIKRLEAVSRSPVYADFSATIQGLVTIRAYGLQQAVQQRFINLINDNARAWYCFLLVSRWLGFRLDLIAALFLFAAAVLVVPLRSTIDVGITGFALVYALSLSSLFQWSVRLSAESENHMTSTERVLKYAHHLDSEPGYAPEFEDGTNPAHDAPTGQTTKEISLVELTPWPSKGTLQVQSLTVTYRPDLPPVLENLSFEIAGGSKVGVVGRTGAGKSSLLLALLRLNQVTSGDILLDGVSLLSIDLKKARSAMAYIPQDPHLFSGTLRFNLDPFNLHSDAKIWDMLEAVQLKEVVASTPEGLDAPVGEDGSNWSVGQRQLLSLARALLRECKVVVCDEATANVDYETDAIIQRVFRESPIIRRNTVITIAHRLRTVGDSDLIIVLEKGRLHCMGPPAELLSFDNNFSQMVERSGERDTIVELAMSAQQRRTSVASSTS
jgi:ABC-type multidrug transport system fused ATPase/permease subunit